MSDLLRITDRYQLDKLVHASDAASVFRAVDLHSRRVVALKLIRPPAGQPAGGAGGGAPGAQARFADACQALQQCNHPSLPPLLDFGFAGSGEAFLAVEYLLGATFDLLAGSPATRVLPLLLPVLDALEELDRHGLAHGNLRADNLLVVPRGGSEEEIKLLGWGGAVAGTGDEGRRNDLRAFAEVACTAIAARVERGPSPVVSLRPEDESQLADASELAILLSLLLQPGGAMPASLSSELRRAFRQALHGDAAGGAPLDLDSAVRADITMAVPRDRLLAGTTLPVAAAAAAGLAAGAGAQAATSPAAPAAAGVRTETLPSFRPEDLSSTRPGIATIAAIIAEDRPVPRASRADRRTPRRGTPYIASAAPAAAATAASPAVDAGGPPVPGAVADARSTGRHAAAGGAAHLPAEPALPPPEAEAWMSPQPSWMVTRIVPPSDAAARPQTEAPPAAAAAPRADSASVLPFPAPPAPSQAAGQAAGAGNPAGAASQTNVGNSPQPSALGSYDPTTAAGTTRTGSPADADHLAGAGSQANVGNSPQPSALGSYAPATAAGAARTGNPVGAATQPNVGNLPAPSAPGSYDPSTAAGTARMGSPADVGNLARAASQANVGNSLEASALGSYHPAAAAGAAGAGIPEGLAAPGGGITPAAAITATSPAGPAARQRADHATAAAAAAAELSQAERDRLDGGATARQPAPALAHRQPVHPPAAESQPSPGVMLASAPAEAPPRAAGRPIPAGGRRGGLRTWIAGGAIVLLAAALAVVAAIATHQRPPAKSATVALPAARAAGTTGAHLAPETPARPAAPAGPGGALTTAVPGANPSLPPGVAPPPADPQLAAVEERLAAGDLAGARRALTQISPAQQAAFGEADRATWARLNETVATDVRGRIAGDLAAGFSRGDMRRLGSALAAAKREQGLPAVLRRDLDRARQAVDLDARLRQPDPPEGQPEALRDATDLLALVPRYGRAAELREAAAKKLEEQADAGVAAGDFDRATQRLSALRDKWPDRAGLQDRADRLEAQRRGDERLTAALAAAERAEAAGQPLQGLEALAAANPGARFRDRFRQERERLSQLLAKLDANPPVVSLRGGAKLEYDKGKGIVVPLHVTDDFAVKTVECFFRAEGDPAYRQIAVRHLAGADYEVAIPAETHQNRNIEIYVAATDPSGHQTLLGTRDQPLKVKRRNWLEKIFIGKEAN
jgi:hypothetical protein